MKVPLSLSLVPHILMKIARKGDDNNWVRMSDSKLTVIGLAELVLTSLTPTIHTLINPFGRTNPKKNTELNHVSPPKLKRFLLSKQPSSYILKPFIVPPKKKKVHLKS